MSAYDEAGEWSAAASTRIGCKSFFTGVFFQNFAVSWYLSVYVYSFRLHIYHNCIFIWCFDGDIFPLYFPTCSSLSRANCSWTTFYVLNPLLLRLYHLPTCLWVWHLLFFPHWIVTVLLFIFFFFNQDCETTISLSCIYQSYFFRIWTCWFSSCAVVYIIFVSAVIFIVDLACDAIYLRFYRVVQLVC